MPVLQIPFVADATVRKLRARNRTDCALRLDAMVEVAEVPEADAPFVVRSGFQQDLFADVDWRRIGGRFARDAGPASDASTVVGASISARTEALVRRTGRAPVETLSPEDAREIERDNSAALRAAVQFMVSEEFVVVGDRLLRFDDPPVATNADANGMHVAWLPCCLWDVDRELLARLHGPRDQAGDVRPHEAPPGPRSDIPDFDRNGTILRHLLRAERLHEKTAGRVDPNVGLVFSAGGSGGAALDIARRNASGEASAETLLEAMETMYADLAARGQRRSREGDWDFPNTSVGMRLGRDATPPPSEGRRHRLRVPLVGGHPLTLDVFPEILDPERAVLVATAGPAPYDGVPAAEGLDIRHDGTDFLVPLRINDLSVRGMKLPPAEDPQSTWLSQIDNATMEMLRVRAPGIDRISGSGRARILADAFAQEIVVVDDRLYRRCSEPFVVLTHRCSTRIVEAARGTVEDGRIVDQSWRTAPESLPGHDVSTFGLSDVPFMVSLLRSLRPDVAERIERDLGVRIVRPDLLALTTARTVCADVVLRVLGLLPTDDLPDALVGELDLIADVARRAADGRLSPDFERAAARLAAMTGGDWLLAGIEEAPETAALRGPVLEALAAIPAFAAKGVSDEMEEADLGAFSTGI